MAVHVSSTMCSSSGDKKLYSTAFGIITPVDGRPVHRLREKTLLSTCAPDGHLPDLNYGLVYKLRVSISNLHIV